MPRFGANIRYMFKEEELKQVRRGNSKRETSDLER